MRSSADGRTLSPSSARLLKTLARVLIAVGVLYALFTQVSFHEVAATLASVATLPLLAALVLSLLTQWGLAWRLRQITDACGVHLTTFQVLEINLSTRFYGLFLPGGNLTSGALRIYRLARAHEGIAAAGVSLLIDRILATLSLCLVGLGFLLLERPSDSIPVAVVMAGTFMAAFVLARLILARSPGPVVSYLRGLLGRATRGKLARVGQAIDRSKTLSSRTLTMAFLVSVVIHLSGVLVFFLAAVAIGEAPSFLAIGWIRTGIILASMVPVSVAGLGLREGAALVLMAPYEVSSAQAVAYSLVVFAVTVLAPGMLGGLFEVRRLTSLGGPEEEPTPDGDAPSN